MYPVQPIIIQERNEKINKSYNYLAPLGILLHRYKWSGLGTVEKVLSSNSAD